MVKNNLVLASLLVGLLLGCSPDTRAAKKKTRHLHQLR